MKKRVLPELQEGWRRSYIVLMTSHSDADDIVIIETESMEEALAKYKEKCGELSRMERESGNARRRRQWERDGIDWYDEDAYYCCCNYFDYDEDGDQTDSIGNVETSRWYNLEGCFL